MTTNEENIKHVTLATVKALFDEGHLTLEELHKHLGLAPPHFTAVSAKNSSSAA
jgi:hypothetical protein